MNKRINKLWSCITHCFIVLTVCQVDSKWDQAAHFSNNYNAGSELMNSITLIYRQIFELYKIKLKNKKKV